MRKEFEKAILLLIVLFLSITVMLLILKEIVPTLLG